MQLPTSKSLSNRALLLCALSGEGSLTQCPSDCDDTRVMQHALQARPATVDIQAAGTAMRFLTAYFALCPDEEHVLTGTERMQQRPIKVLVDALRSLGADISYERNEGFPPLRIRGRQLQGGRLTLPADVSSQYISALLMAAPRMQQGLHLHLTGTIISRPYIDMTLALMQRFGAKAAWTGPADISVEPLPYATDVTYRVESDWSAASYWYELVALSRNADATVVLPGLEQESLQGDSAVARLFEPLGVHTEFFSCGGESCVRLTKTNPSNYTEGSPLAYDLLEQPDLAQTLVVTCAMLRIPFRFTGLQSLRIKETDRMAALQNELRKFGIEFSVRNDCELSVLSYPPAAPSYTGQPIATYNDHRMAMAFAPAATICGEVFIENPQVVSKSYPNFWEDIR